jgi:hypothetical protein
MHGSFRASLFRLGFFDPHLALRLGLLLLGLAFTPQLFFARQCTGRFFHLAFQSFDRAFRASFRPGVPVVIAHRDLLVGTTAHAAQPVGAYVIPVNRDVIPVDHDDHAHDAKPSRRASAIGSPQAASRVIKSCLLDTNGGYGGHVDDANGLTTDERAGGFLPERPTRRTYESVFARLVATAGVVGIGTALGAILVAADVAGWITGLVVSIVTVALAAMLWRSRRL